MCKKDVFHGFIVQVGNLGLLFMLLFFIYAALGVELFGELGKDLLTAYQLPVLYNYLFLYLFYSVIPAFIR